MFGQVFYAQVSFFGDGMLLWILYNLVWKNILGDLSLLKGSSSPYKGGCWISVSLNPCEQDVIWRLWLSLLLCSPHVGLYFSGGVLGLPLSSSMLLFAHPSCHCYFLGQSSYVHFLVNPSYFNKHYHLLLFDWSGKLLLWLFFQLCIWYEKVLVWIKLFLPSFNFSHYCCASHLFIYRWRDILFLKLFLMNKLWI